MEKRFTAQEARERLNAVLEEKAAKKDRDAEAEVDKILPKIEQAVENGHNCIELEFGLPSELAIEKLKDLGFEVYSNGGYHYVKF